MSRFFMVHCVGLDDMLWKQKVLKSKCLLYTSIKADSWSWSC